jgi:hypothetical protein
MESYKKGAVFLLFTLAVAAFQLSGTEAFAQSSYFTSHGCSGCHSAPVASTCNGCHAHGAHPSSAKSSLNVAGTTNKTSYAPGETVTATISGGYRNGWVRVVLYDQNSVELARSTGNASGEGSSATFPATLTAPAPSTPGSYAWKVAWYGNIDDKSGGAFGAGWTPDLTNPDHGYEIVSMAPFTVTAPVDSAAPQVTGFTIPPRANGLTVPVTAFTANDNVGINGYCLTETNNSTSCTSWPATAPTSYTFAGFGAHTLFAFARDSAGNPSPSASAAVTVSPRADFNGDGMPDILWRDSSTGQSTIWLMNGTTHTSDVSLSKVPSNWNIVAMGDFDGDGKPDILWRDSTSGQTIIWLMNGTTHTSDVALGTVPPSWEIVGLGDFNSDGNLDILWRDSTTGQNIAWYMSGTTHAGDGKIGSVPANWKIVGVGDFNSDGKPDILWRDSTTGQNIAWYMNGITHTSDGAVSWVPKNWDAVNVNDFNGDGKPDILWRDSTTGQIIFWLMNGITHTSDVSIGTVGTNWQIVGH